ncbi:MAG: hypothetical protein ACLGI5_05835 [Thermoleophilia bacterium]
MGLKRDFAQPALVVPDEETWLAWRAAGAAAEHAVDWRHARLLVLPEHVPHALAEAVRCAWDLMPAARSARFYDAPLAGIPARELLSGRARVVRGDDPAREAGENDGDGGGHGDEGEHDGGGGGGDDGHGDEGGHGGHGGGGDHGDMMEITGEPSGDGLVMERLEVRAGPLAPGLPGGLVVDATLDGDVVAACRVRPVLRAGPRGAPPDPWAAIAWATAERAAREPSAVVAAGGRWLEVAALEFERAVSHLAWLHGFCRLLGWPRMTDRVAPVLAAAAALRAAAAPAPARPERSPADRAEHTGRADRAGRAEQRRGAQEVQAAATALAGALAASRWFGMRTAGLAETTRDDVDARRLAGPLARAAGAAEDARADDPGYGLLGFAPLVREDGDARARALVRAGEAAQALGLAAAAIARAAEPHGDGDAGPALTRATAGIPESARGPLLVSIAADGSPRRAAPGAGAACAAAAELAVGREWSAALVTIASFDLSPWQVAA